MNDKGYKNLPIGVSSFQDVIVSDFYYVDKTMLIQRLLDYQGRVMLFTRPRHFGKPLALDMLHCFFDCHDSEENRKLFDGLTITKSERHMAEQGKYPVIHVNFGGERYSSWEQAQKLLPDYLAELFDNFNYLLDNPKLSQLHKEKFILIQTKNADMNLLRNSLRFLCDLLHRHHGQPVVLLIDEYDVPLQGAYQNNFYDEMVNFMRAFMTNSLKDNASLRLAVLTGVMRIAKDSLFSGLNNLTVDTILSKRYSDCFGFTQSEIEDMAHYYEADDKIPEIQAWYDGYRFGQQDIYNPWSVMHYFTQDCEAKDYWVDTASNDLTVEFLRRLEDIKRGTKVKGLDQLAEAALKQIEDKRYADVFPPEVREVRCYGLAFCRKKCALRTKSIKRE